MLSDVGGDDRKYVFQVTWYDKVAQLERQFFLIYYVADGSVELYDRKARRVFLRRTVCVTEADDLFVGNVVNVLSRKLRLDDCLNEENAVRLERNPERTVIVLNVDAKRTAGRILDATSARRLRAVRLTETTLTENGVALLRTYCHRQWQPLNAFDRVMLVEIVGAESVEKTADILDDIVRRLRCGTSEHDVLYQTSSMRHLSRDQCKALVGTTSTPPPPAVDRCTCCLVKPHAFKEGLAGKIIVDIVDYGFEIAFIQMVHLDFQQSESFLEVYKGVVDGPDHQEMVSQLVSGPLLATAIRGHPKAKPGDVVGAFRRFVGPADPAIARQIRPESLRAKYGTDRLANALHCTDLNEDGQTEVEFFFTQRFRKSQQMY